MTHAKGYVDSSYLSVSANLAKEFKQRSHALMQIQAGHSVLDVGCGPASDTIALAQLVGSEGQVVGIDYDAAMVTEANQKAEQAGVRSYVTHHQGDATNLPFEANSFDSCRSERLFQHLKDPAQALSEMIRITRPGGWVVVADADWGTLSIHTNEVAIERKLARIAAEHFVNNGYAGRQLYGLFQRHELVDLSAEMVSFPFTSYPFFRQVFLLDRIEQEALNAGVVTSNELARWHEDLEQTEAQGAFFGSIANVLIAGRKPT